MSKPSFYLDEKYLVAFAGVQRKRLRRMFFVALAAFVALPWLNAQSDHCAIAGRVVDSSGAILQGAEVRLLPQGLGAASNAEGEFGFTDLAPGSYKLSVSYVGFNAIQPDVTCTAGRVEHVDAKMAVGSLSAEVIVTAERPRGEAEAINRSRTADNILQVLPAEVITSLPNANVADALGRLPSVTLEVQKETGHEKE